MQKCQGNGDKSEKKKSDTNCQFRIFYSGMIFQMLFILL